MKKLFITLTVLTSVTASANNGLKTLHTTLKSDMSKTDKAKFCISESNRDANICLMNRSGATEYCKQIGKRLPTALDFALMAKNHGAYVGNESCGETHFCQRVSPVNESAFFYNSRGADIQNILPDYWYHTSSLRESGANFHFDSDSGFMGSSSDENPGNVACL